MQRIRALDGTLLVHHDAASFALRIGGNAPGTLYLDSLCKDYLHASQEDREAVLRRQATVSVAPAAPLPSEGYETNIRPYLRPIIRSRAYAAFLPNDAPDDGTQERDAAASVLDLPFRPLGDDRGIYLAFDREETLSHVGVGSLQAWGVDFDRALSDAVANLRVASLPAWEPMEGGFFRAAWQDSYGCSRLLLPEMFADLGLAGRPVAVASAREDLFVADEHNPVAQRAMLQHARARLEENNRWTAGSLLVLHQGTAWTAFRSADSAVRQAEVNLRNVVLHREYDSQKKALDRVHARTQANPVWTEPFLASETAQGDVFSACRYCQAAGEALLPEVDKLFFFECDARGALMQSPLAVVPWEVAQAIVGTLMAKVDTYPPRYLVKQFPDAEMCERLRAASVFPAHMAARQELSAR
ncbi:hypothetical protein VLK31_09085 [Variovorax sp. H27-G14]|uniref:hypothetical protein n=1 Tax=Variovorax sp. H27-G14 TaxID=3111914 RepID=UPI0038FC8CF4